MALHAPTHHAGFHNEHLLRNAALAVVLALFLVATVGLALNVSVVTGPSSGMNDEQKALIDYRAGERADWASGATTEIQSLIQFRASERSGN